jgi:UDP-GlcNAc:undecaprenyl-phosphate GlcNAc-1-phosphate transferase
MLPTDLIRDYIIISLLAFLISVTLTPIVRRYCQKGHALDFPTIPRKIHTVPVPRLGGIAIYLGFFLPLFAVFLTDGKVYELFAQRVDTLISLFVTSTLVFAIGIYDDIRGATVFQKLVVQLAAAVIIYFLGFKIQLLSIPFVGSVNPGILGFPLTILWIVGVTNAINFIDGVDGLACGVGFFSVSTMFILSLFLHRTLTAFFAAALAGGLFGFVLYNFAPATIFMGDSGSLFIGFIIATISLYGLQKSSTAVVLLIPIIVLGVPIADTVLAIIRRIGNGRSPFTADKEHIHHRLLRMGLSSRQVTLILYAVCSSLGITALLMTAVNNKLLTLILIMLSVMVIGGMKMLGYTADMMEINHLAKERIQQKKRFLVRQRCANGIIAEIQASSDLATLKKTLIRYFESMEFDVGKLLGKVGEPVLSEVEGSKTEEPLRLTWYSPRYTEQRIAPDHIWTMSIPLIINNEKYGEFLVGKYLDSPTSLLESTLLVENLKYAVEHALSRILMSDSSAD